MVRFAGIEGGGTGWRAAVAVDDPRNITELQSFPTTTPEETMGLVAKWLRQFEPFDAIGVATFGPVDPDPESATYGFITNTPKKLWVNTDVLGYFKEAFPGIPARFDTDVNAPAVAEHTMNCPELTSCMYVTVGTGVGVGLVVNGKPVHGLVHPEGGHVLLKRREGDAEKFAGTCPFHGSCVEGLCSAGALAAFAGCHHTDLPGLPDDHDVWDAFAHTMGSLCATAALLVSPERIILSGGVMKRASLFDKVREKCRTVLNDYIVHGMMQVTMDQYITPSPWGDMAGIIGSTNLAKIALDGDVETPARFRKNRGSSYYASIIALCIAIPVCITVGVIVGHYFTAKMSAGNTGHGYDHIYDPQEREDMIRRLSAMGGEGAEQEL